MPFYNCHIHVFSSQCAPERFLEVGLPSWLDFAAGGIKSFLETKFGLWLTHKLKGLKSSGRITKVAARYASFASVGTMATQKMVFENILQFYPVDTRFVVLTLNMDYMGAGPSELTFRGQVDEVIQLRRLYPDACLPFLSIDPRMGSADEIVAFVKTYVKEGGPFIGVKLYPALGYFPFDCRLDKMYDYCQTNNIPIMTHCTKYGAFYLGPMSATMGLPCSIQFQYTNEDGKKITLPKLPEKFPSKHNDQNCDVFLSPAAWHPVFCNYPELKVCFAHMGGSDEIMRSSATKKPTWYDDVKMLMGAYPNVYTDISYTLADKGKGDRIWKEIIKVLDKDLKPAEIPRCPHPPGNAMLHTGTMHERILFGTDYFMTQQEDEEANLARDLPDSLLKMNRRDLFDRLTEANPSRFLSSAFFNP